MPASPDRPPHSNQATLTAFLAMAHQVGAKSVREAVFLSNYPSTDLPKAMFAAALGSIPLALLVTRAMTRWGPSRVAPLLFGLSAALWGFEWMFLPQAVRAVALLIFFHVSIGGAILLSTFWSAVSECFDPHTLKRLVSRIGAAATMGGMFGGALIERTSHWLDAQSTMLVLAGICGVAGIGIGLLTRSPVASATVVDTPGSTGF
ncbi:MAG TPA: hypothetical protein VIV60_23140, partial [Polyangiaceae bacterium]